MTLFELFNADTRRAMFMARDEARRSRTAFIEAPHIIIAVLSDSSFGAVRALNQSGADVERIRSAVIASLTHGTGKDPGPAARIPFSLQAKLLIEGAATVAFRFKHPAMDTAHLLAADLQDSQGTLPLRLPDLDLGLGALDLKVKVLKFLEEPQG